MPSVRYEPAQCSRCSSHSPGITRINSSSCISFACRPSRIASWISGASFVSRLLDLTLLAPDIQEAILEGRQSKGIQLDELMGAMPGAWEEQQEHCAGSYRTEGTGCC